MFGLSLRRFLPILLGFFFLLVTLVALGVSRHFLVAQTEADAVHDVRGRLHTTQGTLERFLMLNHPEGVKKVVSASGSDLDLLVQLVADHRGVVIASTDHREEGTPWTELGRGLDPDLVREVTAARISRVVTSDDGQRLDGYISVCDPNAGGGLRAPRCGFLFHRIDLGMHYDQAMSSLYQQAKLLAVGFGLSTLALILLFDRMVTSRVARLVDTLGRFGRGERDARVGLAGRDEFARVGGQVDELLDRLARDEAALRENEQVKRAIIDSANAAIISTDSSGLLQTFSAGAERMLGYRAADLVGRVTPVVFHDPGEVADRARALSRELGRPVEPGFEVLTARAARGEHDESDWTYVCKDGSRINVDLSISVLTGPGGEVTGFMGIARDVTGEKAAAQRLRLAERVFEGAGEAIVVTDPDTRIVDVNPAYLESTGYTREEVIGSTPKLVSSGRHKREFFREMWETIRETGRWSGELWDRRKNGDVFPQWLTINAIADDNGKVTHYVGIFKDVTQQKAVEEKLERMAYYDPLTGLPNRALLRDRLEHEIELAERSDSRLAVLFLDLDRFKYVNDTLGHDAGDQLLVDAAKRIRGCVRQSDTIARLGGDEFTLVLANVGETGRVADLADKIIHALQLPFRLGSSEVFIGASIGIALYPDDGRDFLTLTKNADAAMYQAKHAGRGRHKFFTTALNAANKRRMRLESRLRSALEREEFDLRYQPLVDMDGGQVLGFEALLRWNTTSIGSIPPEEFLPLAEDTGLIVELGTWALGQVCATLRRWHDAGFGQLHAALNLSAKQFHHEGLIGDVQAMLRRYHLPAGALQLELSESLIMEDVDRSLLLMSGLRKLGVRMTVDDFGTGYSSLAYLKKLPIDTLKIDRSFVRDITTDRDDPVIVKAILSLALQLGLEAVAEGVETREQHELLREEGCHRAQGFYYALPMADADALEFVRQHAHTGSAAGSHLTVI